MSGPLASCKAVIIVAMMPGCPACEDYKPRLERQIKGFQGYGVPLAYYTSGDVPVRTIPVVYLDATSVDPSMQQFLDGYGISGMPTTLLLTHNARPALIEGAIDDQQIYDLLISATLANR